MLPKFLGTQKLVENRRHLRKNGEAVRWARGVGGRRSGNMSPIPGGLPWNDREEAGKERPFLLHHQDGHPELVPLPLRPLPLSHASLVHIQEEG